MIDDLNILVDNFERHKNFYSSNAENYNEHSTRVEYIDPLLKLLGWDVENINGVRPNRREVIPENYSNRGHRPDYTMTLSGVNKFFIEAKKPSVKIQDDKESVLQARRYGYSAKHFITVLTNFEYLLIYDATIIPKENDEPHVALLAKFKYTDYVDKWEDIKSFLSRETIYSGLYEKTHHNLLDARDRKTVDKYFLEQINDWRLKLSNLLYQSNPSKYSIEKINDIVQKFINQIIFLRICEDRNLPLYHNLQETLEDENVIKEKLLNLLEHADTKYNSGLFDDENEIIIDLSNDVIMDIIKSLYYPQSPFIFRVIDANILGEIYELFLSEKLDVENNEIVLKRVKKTKDNKPENRDVVSTPQEVVKFMVDNTLSKHLANKSPDEILNMSFADIACGSGVFLVEIYKYLIEYIKEWYWENNMVSYLFEGENSEYHLSYEMKKRILVSCIYGIDIDSNAVEAAQFNLLLSLLENETIPSLDGKNRLLPVLDQNITVGNSLVDYTHIDITSLSGNELYSISPFDWNTISSQKFDVILGNPPYVHTQDMRAFLPKKEFKIYKDYYVSSHKQFDKYYIFLERALTLLKPDGKLSFIIPNKFSKTQSGTKLRGLLSTKYNINEFIDFGSTQIFKDKNVITYSSILSITNSIPNTDETFAFEDVSDIHQWWKNVYDHPSLLKRIDLNRELINEDPWVLVSSEEEWTLLESLYSDSMLLGDSTYFKTVNGIQTSAESTSTYSIDINEIYDEDEEYFYIRKKGEEYKIEKAILKVYFKPRRSKDTDINSYNTVEPFLWIIFPYDINGHIYPQNIMERDFPFTWEYLNDCYEELLPKQFSSDGKGRDVPHATRETWYHYGRSQAFKLFNNTPKLIIGINTHVANPLNLLDQNDMVIASGGTAGYCAITIEDDSPYALAYIHAVLNHPALIWLCSVMGSDFEGDYYSRGTYVLNRLPIKKIDFDDNEQVAQYHTIINKTNMIDEINLKLQDSTLRDSNRTILGRQKQALINDIQNCVTKIYDIDHLLDYIIID